MPTVPGYKPPIYICSGLEFADKSKLNWREWMREELKESYDVIVPAVLQHTYKKGDPEFARWYYENYIRVDIGNIYRSHEFFAYIDESFLNGAGGKAEVTIAKMWYIPITYYLTLSCIEDLPAWVIGNLVNATRVYDLKEAVAYYKAKIINDVQKTLTH